MFDSYLVPLVQHPLRYGARLCMQLGVSETTVTLLGLVTSFLLVLFLWMQWYMLALCLVVINRICDGLDGAIARERGTQNPSGGFIDIVIDFVFYGSLPLGMALSNREAFVLPSVFLLFFYMLSGVIFMASAAAAGTLGMTSSAFSNKSLYYSINVIEGFETIVFFLFCCIFPYWYHILAYIMAGLLLLSLPLRVYTNFKAFRTVEREIAQESNVQA